MASFVVHYDRCDICNCIVAILFDLRIVKKNLNNKKMETKQTAIMWFYHEMIERERLTPNLLREAIEMEKKQITDAHQMGWSDAYDYLRDDVDEARQAEDYYNEIYKKP
jgi:hypothetical protein